MLLTNSCHLAGSLLLVTRDVAHAPNPSSNASFCLPRSCLTSSHSASSIVRWGGGGCLILDIHNRRPAYAKPRWLVNRHTRVSTHAPGQVTRGCSGDAGSVNVCARDLPAHGPASWHPFIYLTSFVVVGGSVFDVAKGQFLLSLDTPDRGRTGVGWQCQKRLRHHAGSLTRSAGLIKLGTLSRTYWMCENLDFDLVHDFASMVTFGSCETTASHRHRDAIREDTRSRIRHRTCEPEHLGGTECYEPRANPMVTSRAADTRGARPVVIQAQQQE